MESIPCIFGHGFSENIVIHENGFQGRRCPTCGLIYISPRPKAGQPTPVRPENPGFSENASLPHDPSAELAAHTYFNAIYSRHPTYHAVGEKPLSILHLDCGRGELLRVARDAGLEPFGVESRPQFALQIRESLKLPCETEPFSAATFGDRKFDIIFHSGVANALYDPIASFTAMREKLHPHGQLIFEINNDADVDPRHYKLFPTWQFPRQLFLFGENSIQELLHRAGFGRSYIVSWSTLPQRILARMLGSRNRRVPWKKSQAQVLHFARYTLGSFSSNRRVPRTMLIWAMK